MPFISTPERYGLKQGLRKGIGVVLELRFGEAGSSRTAASPEELRRLWTS